MSTPGTSSASSKSAWRDIPRVSSFNLPSGQKLAEFLETHGVFDEQTAREQATRCIQCPNPSCVGGCPLCNPIPEWMSLTAEGRFAEASARLGAVTNFAEICARLCPSERLCEESCLLNGSTDPVAIAAIEHFLAEYALEHGIENLSTAPPNGLRVAVLGSGPGPLACADQLAKLGYSLTVFEPGQKPGGLLFELLPDFELDHRALERRIAILQKLGVTFRYAQPPGALISLRTLRSEFDAVFLGFDSRQPSKFEVPGATSAGVVGGLEFLLQMNTPLRMELPPLVVEGKRVAVVGGSDLAVHSMRTALRFGAAEVTCVYAGAEQQLPCLHYTVDQAKAEGGRFMFHTAPVAVLANDQGAVRALRLRHRAAHAGEAPPQEPEFELAADLVIPALGFEMVPCPHDADWGDLAVSPTGAVLVDADQRTNLPQVYAAGDIVRGPALLLHDVRDARRAAAAIHASLAARRPPTPPAPAP